MKASCERALFARHGVRPGWQAAIVSVLVDTWCWPFACEQWCGFLARRMASVRRRKAQRKRRGT